MKLYIQQEKYFHHLFCLYAYTDIPHYVKEDLVVQCKPITRTLQEALEKWQRETTDIFFFININEKQDWLLKSSDRDSEFRSSHRLKIPSNTTLIDAYFSFRKAMQKLY
jgi:hypothetical protein